MNAPEPNPEDEILHESLRPAFIFRGKELWPFSRGARLVYAQVCSPEDTLIYRALALVFLLTKRGATTAAADRGTLDAWDLKSFHQRIDEFRDTFPETEADAIESEAIRIANEAVSGARKTDFVAGPKPGSKPGGAKKKAVTRPSTSGKPRKSRSSRG